MKKIFTISSMRSKSKYIFVIIVIIILGLLSRKISFVPLFVWDILWAMMISYLALLFTNLKLIYIVYISSSICFFVEFSQLIHFELLDSIRNTTIWWLVLGRWFLWSDLIAYSFWVWGCLSLSRCYHLKKISNK